MRLALIPLLLLLGCSNGGGDDDTGDAPVDPGPDEVVDVFDQTLTSPVDILWVMDSGWAEGNSELSGEVLNNVFETLLLADPSWRIGILDAAARSQTFGLIREKFETYPVPPATFDLPQDASPARVRDAVYTALDLRAESDDNKEFIRSDAHLYVLVYTDEQDQSEELDEETFQQWLRDFQPSNSKRLGAITVEGKAGYWGRQAQGGIVVSEGTFRKRIEAVFRDAIGQKTEFVLTREPIAPPELVSVVYREHKTEYVVGDDFSYDPETRTVSFVNAVPPADSQVVVTYLSDDEPAVATETGTETEATTP